MTENSPFFLRYRCFGTCMQGRKSYVCFASSNIGAVFKKCSNFVAKKPKKCSEI